MENKESVYKNDVAPLMQELIKICNENKMPLFIAVGIGDLPDESLDIKSDNNYKEKPSKQKKTKKKGVDIKSSTLLPEVVSASTEDERFSRFVNVMNGFDTIMNRIETIDMDELEIKD